MYKKVWGLVLVNCNQYEMLSLIIKLVVKFIENRMKISLDSFAPLYVWNNWAFQHGRQSAPEMAAAGVVLYKLILIH